ncbi:MAG: NADH-quinone oxidoreductase subunit NuoF [Tepidisphaeraceae bacterium]|jgi:bidirectional [NiFe] hydrogenase diaphorase subunit
MTPEDLSKITHEELAGQTQYTHFVNVCVAAGCLSSKSDAVKSALETEVKARGLEGKCKVRGVGCLGLCAAGPLVAIEKPVPPEKADDEYVATPASMSGVPQRMYHSVKPEDAAEVIASVGNKPVARIDYNVKAPFFARQKKIVLENSGFIDPERIEEYIAAGGYKSLLKCLTGMTSADVVAEIQKSGLRGRGGAGFPTGLKWSTVAKAKGPTKYVVCNGDEGDPGAFMDRAVLESDPHRVLEGMAIAAYAVGAQKGYLYVRAEYPLAVKRLKLAIKQAEKTGVLGQSIFGTTFSFTCEIRLGAGAFVCGEETALLASIEGRRGQPRPRPPFPAEKGLWDCPTLINNVETFANVPPILREGAEWFAGIGRDKSKGTKVFALAGAVKNTGLIEVPMGINLRDIIYDIGGGILNDKKFKAVQTGGPSGGCIPEQFLDMPVDYESLAQVGSIMGSGGMIIMDETADMVDVAKFFMEFCMTESCGKCTPCRVGTCQLYNVLDKISKGAATDADIEFLKELCDMVRNTSLCGLGMTAPNPVLSTLRYFKHEYDAKLNRPAEPAGAEVAR